MALGTVHAFEPQRIIFQQLCGNAFLNGLDNIVPYEMAVGNPQSSPEHIDFPDPGPRLFARVQYGCAVDIVVQRE